MSDAASIFPLQEMMLICNGCGGERKVPTSVIEKILSVQDFDKFAKGDIVFYACKCGKEPRTCDIRMLPNAAAMSALKETPEGD